MANKDLSPRLPGLLPKADARNEAGGTAYSSPGGGPRPVRGHGVPQLDVLRRGGEQLATVLDLAGRVDADFVARTRSSPGSGDT